MYVRESARGTGVADAIMARLEEETAEAGLSVLRLETGTRQHAALRFYERVGFRRCEVFGDYAALPAPAIEGSIFCEKPLARAA